MCGIAGWLKRGTEQVTAEELKKLISELSSRGHDATGVSWQTGDTIYVLKSPVKGDTFIKSPELDKVIPDILASPWVFIHCRLATHGSPTNNKNNHPIYNDRGLLIHNGVCWATEHIPAQGQTDSEQILLHIQKYGFKGIANFGGGMAIAYIDYKKKGFYLYADGGRPIVYGTDARNIFYFCSTAIILNAALTVPITTTDIVDNTVFKINEGMREVYKIKTREITYKYYGYSDGTNNYAYNYPGVKTYIVGKDGKLHLFNDNTGKPYGEEVNGNIDETTKPPADATVLLNQELWYGD